MYCSPDMPGYSWYEFEDTQIMPTYIIAIIVSDFKDVSAPPEITNGKEVKVRFQHYF